MTSMMPLKTKVPHGTLSMYRYGCRCDECKTANTAYLREYYWKYLKPLTPPGIEPPVGSRRRLEGLTALGYSLKTQARLMGRSHATTVRLTQGVQRYIVTATADDIRALYARLSMKVPRCGSPDCPEEAVLYPTNGHCCSIVQTRRFARRKGWLPPLAWDDEALDDPDATPAIAGRDLRIVGSRRDRFIEAVEVGLQAGEGERCIRDMRLGGIDADTFARRLQRAGRNDLLRWARHGVPPVHQPKVPYITGTHGHAS